MHQSPDVDEDRDTDTRHGHDNEDQHTDSDINNLVPSAVAGPGARLPVAAKFNARAFKKRFSVPSNVSYILLYYYYQFTTITDLLCSQLFRYPLAG